MADKAPFDYTAMVRAFTPDDMARMFRPFQTVRFDSERIGNMDVSAMMAASLRNMEALLSANAAATAAYAEIVEKQLEVMGQLGRAAREHGGRGDAAPDTVARGTAACGAALEQTADLMRKMAETARDANAEAYETLKTQMSDAIVELRKISGQ